jgi:hypothetical protein
MIETRAGSTATDLRRDTPLTPGLDLEFSLGGQRYALEHTRVEPYPLQIADNLAVTAILEPIEDRVRAAGLVPKTGFTHLLAPAGDLGSIARSRWQPIQDALYAWTAEHLPSLGVIKMVRATPAGVPFQVVLRRFDRPEGIGFFKVARMAPEDGRGPRLTRMGDALKAKLPKLDVSHHSGERAVLVLENQDHALSNVVVIAEAFEAAVEESAFCPDQVYVVEPFSEDRWTVWLIRDGTLNWTDLSRDGARYFDVDPKSLALPNV